MIHASAVVRVVNREQQTFYTDPSTLPVRSGTERLPKFHFNVNPADHRTRYRRSYPDRTHFWTTQRPLATGTTEIRHFDPGSARCSKPLLRPSIEPLGGLGHHLGCQGQEHERARNGATIPGSVDEHEKACSPWNLGESGSNYQIVPKIGDLTSVPD
ncbi:uncharacterized protein BDW43DRAFT_268649 [Aspergillus alliaceus]|uniref:uncharacterized protein n=1 Tax=Petromyces alliaceus TaxID=209559 RepID=UPI0012A45783|nr:uncharacterized protein BDW43DRAFT_268649 [Aspergillus alliaceus]KAB8235935.1 hypothetical protein BDW43DRAFT_268649 [Aspergillus alliaceus]